MFFPKHVWLPRNLKYQRFKITHQCPWVLSPIINIFPRKSRFSFKLNTKIPHFNKQNPFLSLYSQTLSLLTLHEWKVSLISKSLSLFTVAPWPELTSLAFFSTTCHCYRGSVGPSSWPLRRWCASGRDMKWWTVLDGF